MVAAAADTSQPEAHPRIRVAARGRTGWSGTTTQWGARPGDAQEHNYNLRGANAARAVEKMLRTSTAFATGTDLWIAYLLKSKFRAAKPRKDASDEPTALVNEAFGWTGGSGWLGTSWSEVLEYMILSRWLGWRVLEVVWRVEGGQHRFTVEDRDPLTHHDWRYENGNLVRWEQTAEPGPAGNWRPYVEGIDGYGLLLNWHASGGNIEGRGVYRSAWGAWNDLQETLRLLAAAGQRYAIPPIDIEIDWQYLAGLGSTLKDSINPRQTPGARIEAELEELQEQARNLTSHENGWISHYKGFTLKPLTAGTYDPQPFIATARFHEHRILRRLLAQHLDLGVTQTGARSVGDTHEEVRQISGVHILQRIAERIGGPPRPWAGLVGWLVKRNLGESALKDLPRIEVGGLVAPAWLKYVNALAQMPEWLSPQDEDEKTLRSGFELPDLPEGFTRSPEDRRGARATAAEAPAATQSARTSKATDVAARRRERRNEKAREADEKRDDAGKGDDE